MGILDAIIYELYRPSLTRLKNELVKSALEQTRHKGMTIIIVEKSSDKSDKGETGD